MIVLLHYGLDEYSIVGSVETNLATFYEWTFSLTGDGTRYRAVCRKGALGARFADFCRRYTNEIEFISLEDEEDSLPTVKGFVGEIFYSSLRSPARYVLNLSIRAIRERTERLALDREITLTLSNDGTIETVDIDDSDDNVTHAIAVCERMIAIWKEFRQAIDEYERATTTSWRVP